MNPILFVLVFLATVLALEGLYLLVQGRRRSDPARVRKRLQVLAGRLQAPDAANAGTGETLLRGVQQGRRTLADFVLSLVPNRKSLELLLYRAGMPLTTSRFLIASVAFSAAGWIVASVMTYQPGLAMVGLAAGLVPWVLVKRMASQRMRAFEEQFPDGLELLTRAMRAGHALSVGFRLVGDEMADPLGTEFSQVAEEIKFGLDVRHALANLAHRIDSRDLPYFVTAVLIQRESGGNLAELLDNLGYLVRERAKFHGKVRALTAQGRLSAAILAVWPFITAGLLVLIHPFYIQPMIETHEGHLAALGALALVVLGYLSARRLAEVKV